MNDRTLFEAPTAPRDAGTPETGSEGTLASDAKGSGPPPVVWPEQGPQDRVPPELARAIRGFHLRAARALLDWPMPVLARSSALSLSTVKRLEENRDLPLSRSRVKAIEALRRAGIRFLVLDDGSVAVARSKPDIDPDDAAHISRIIE